MANVTTHTRRTKYGATVVGQHYRRGPVRKLRINRNIQKTFIVQDSLGRLHGRTTKQRV